MDQQSDSSCQFIMSYLFPLEATPDSLVSCRTLPTELMATSKMLPSFHFLSGGGLFGGLTVQELVGSWRPTTPGELEFPSMI